MNEITAEFNNENLEKVNLLLLPLKDQSDHVGAFFLVNYIVEFLQYANIYKKTDIKSHQFIDPLELA